MTAPSAFAAAASASASASAPRRLQAPDSPSPLRHRSSDYLVLRRVDSASQDLSLPRPRAWWLLALLGILDAACSVAAAVHRVESGLEWGLIACGLGRAVCVVAACSTVRIRETGWIIVGCALVGRYIPIYTFTQFIAVADADLT